MPNAPALCQHWVSLRLSPSRLRHDVVPFSGFAQDIEKASRGSVTVLGLQVSLLLGGRPFDPDRTVTIGSPNRVRVLCPTSRSRPAVGATLPSRTPNGPSRPIEVCRERLLRGDKI